MPWTNLREEIEEEFSSFAPDQESALALHAAKQAYYKRQWWAAMTLEERRAYHRKCWAQRTPEQKEARRQRQRGRRQKNKLTAAQKARKLDLQRTKGQKLSAEQKARKAKRQSVLRRQKRAARG